MNTGDPPRRRVESRHARYVRIRRDHGSCCASASASSTGSDERTGWGSEGLARESGTGVSAGVSAAAVGGTAGVVIGSLIGCSRGRSSGSAIGEKSGFWLARGKR